MYYINTGAMLVNSVFGSKFFAPFMFICNLFLFLLLFSATHFECITVVSFGLPTQIDNYVCTYLCNLILSLCMSAEGQYMPGFLKLLLVTKLVFVCLPPKALITNHIKCTYVPVITGKKILMLFSLFM